MLDRGLPFPRGPSLWATNGHPLFRFVGVMIHRLVRHRYLLLSFWAALVMIATRFAYSNYSDYDYFLAGGKILLGGHMHNYSGSPLDFYATVPLFQIGPPPLYADGVLQRLVPSILVNEWVWDVLIMACGVMVVRAIERTLLALGYERARCTRTIAIAGPALIAAWSSLIKWEHGDDALAVVAVALAIMVMAEHRQWWMSAALVGTGAAAKPWAAVALPLVLAVPRARRVHALGLAIVVAFVWWAPYVIGNRDTVHELMSYDPGLAPRSSPWPFFYEIRVIPTHLHVWMLLIGPLLCAVAVLRGRWLAAPLVGFGVRMLFDPVFFLYYAVGPLVAAILWDSTRPRPWPIVTSAVASVEFGMQVFAPPSIGALAQLLLSLVMIGYLFWPPMRARRVPTATYGELTPIAA